MDRRFGDSDRKSAKASKPTSVDVAGQTLIFYSSLVDRSTSQAHPARRARRCIQHPLRHDHHRRRDERFGGRHSFGPL